jgi:hypothetical protein
MKINMRSFNATISALVILTLTGCALLIATLSLTSGYYDWKNPSLLMKAHRKLARATGNPSISLGVDLQGGVRQTVTVRKPELFAKSIDYHSQRNCGGAPDYFTYQGGVRLFRSAGVLPAVRTTPRHEVFDPTAGRVKRMVDGSWAIIGLLGLLTLVRLRWRAPLALAALLWFLLATAGLMGVLHVQLTFAAWLSLLALTITVGLLITFYPRQNQNDAWRRGRPKRSTRATLARAVAVHGAIWLAVCTLAPGWWQLVKPVVAAHVAAALLFAVVVPLRRTISAALGSPIASPTFAEPMSTSRATSPSRSPSSSYPSV